MQYLPETIKVGVVGVAIVIIAFAFFVYQAPKTPETVQNKVGEIAVVDNQVFKNVAGVVFSGTDSDSDGLRDWEETLWGTDINNPDSDGDGTSDGEEVDQNRDPTVPAPNDLRKTVPPSPPNKKTTVPSTITEAFSQQFFSDYLRLRQTGDLASEEGINLLLQSASAVASPYGQPKIYSRTDVLVAPNETKESIKNYGNIMGAILEQNPVPNKSETVILQEAVETKNPSVLEELTPIINAYTTMRSESEKVVVPKSASVLHLSLLNILSRLETDIVAMQKIFDDPLYTLSVIPLYGEDIGELINVLLSINKYFLAAGVTFNTTEVGYSFANALNTQ